MFLAQARRQFITKGLMPQPETLCYLYATFIASWDVSLYLLIMSLTSLKTLSTESVNSPSARDASRDSYVSAAASSPCCGFGLAWPVGAASARAAGTDATKANS